MKNICEQVKNFLLLFYIESAGGRTITERQPLQTRGYSRENNAYIRKEQCLFNEKQCVFKEKKMHIQKEMRAQKNNAYEHG